MTASRTPALEASDGPASTPDSGLFYVSGGGGGSPPPSCSVTLSGAIGPAFGYSAADVSGQSFSVTSAATGVYLASSPFASAGVRRAMPASGKKCWIQTQGYSASTGNVRAGFLVFNSGGSVVGHVAANGGASPSGVASAIAFYNAAGAYVGGFVLPQGNVSYLSLGMDSAGEVYFYRADTTSVVACSSIDSGISGFFSTASTIVLFGLCDLSGGGPGTMGATFVTDQGSMTDVSAFSGDEDWCVGAIS